MSNPDPLSVFEIITNSEVLNPSPPTTPGNPPTPEHRMSEDAISENKTLENPTPENSSTLENSSTPESTAITTSDLEKLYKFSTSLVDQHNLALQTIRSYETEKFLTLLSIKDLLAKQDEILSLCTRLAKAHSLGEPVGIPEEGILSYMLDCIENLQRPLDSIEDKLGEVEEKIDNKMDDMEENMQGFEDHVVDHVIRVEEKLNKKLNLSENLDLSHKILKRVTVLEEALLHDIDDEFGFIHHHQEGILGYLSDEIFNLVHQIEGFEGNLQEMVDGVEESLHEFVGESLEDIGERITSLHERVDSSVQDSSKMLEMCSDIRKQLLDAEGNVKSTFLNSQEEINQRLGLLEGRVESLGTVISPKETMSDVFEGVALEAKLRKQRRDLLESRVRSMGTSKSSMNTMPPSMHDLVDIPKFRKFGVLPTAPPSSPFNIGADAKPHTNPSKLPESPTASFRKPNKPSTSKTGSTTKPQNLAKPSSTNFDLFPKINSSFSEQSLPKLRVITTSACGTGKRTRSPSPKFNGGLSNPRPKPTTQKDLPPFIPPSKLNPKPPFSLRPTTGSPSTLQVPKINDEDDCPFGVLTNTPPTRKSKDEMKNLARTLSKHDTAVASAFNEKKPVETSKNPNTTSTPIQPHQKNPQHDQQD